MKTTTKHIVVPTTDPAVSKKSLIMTLATYGALFAGWIAFQLQK